MGIGQVGTTPGNLAENTFAFRDTGSWVRGVHALKFGVDITREKNNDDEPVFERPLSQFRGLLNFANDPCCFFENVPVDPRPPGPPTARPYFRYPPSPLFSPA